MFCIIKIKSETNSHHSEESMSAQNRKSCNTAIRSVCHTPEPLRRRNGLRCAALFLRLRTAPRTGLRLRAGRLRLRAGRPRVARPEGLRAARAAGGGSGGKKDGATDCGAVAARRFARVHRFGNASNAPARRQGDVPAGGRKSCRLDKDMVPEKRGGIRAA